MADVRPLRGLRYAAERVGGLERVVCPPYDVIAPAQAAALRASSPWNAIHVELPEPAGEQDRYAHAATLLRAWQAAGVLVREAAPLWYAVEEEFTWAGRSYRRRGVLAGVQLARWEDGVVLPHERTLAGPKADRLALLQACATNLSPVFLLYPPQPTAEAAFWERARAQPTLFEVDLGEQGRARCWAVGAEQGAWREALADQRLYVADGHHRYETALRYRDELAATGAPLPRGANYVLSYLVSLDDPGLLLLPTHRCAPAGSVEPAALQALLAERFEVAATPASSADPAAVEEALAQRARAGDAPPTLGVYVRGTLFLARATAAALAALPAERDPAWRVLDVAQADALLLQPLLGPQAAERLTYTRDVGEALALVDRGAAAFAVVLNPLAASQMAAVAEAHERMPQKSTYFYPKLPTGLLFHRLDERALG